LKLPIEAKILAHSISPAGKEIITYEINLPKVLLAEYNTHSLIARNFSSSRAIPTKKNVAIESFEPVFYGKNQSGMVAKNEEIEHKKQAQEVWQLIINTCKQYSDVLSQLGLHKQWANRPNDWHVMAKGVTTATEWENFFWLRDAEDAQPEIAMLAKQMRELKENSTPMLLKHGEWHLPYINVYRGVFDDFVTYIDPESGESLSLEDAKMVSMARCAAVSYRTEKIGIEKASDIYKKLFSGNKVHASPAMHQATPMDTDGIEDIQSSLSYMLNTDGVTHMDKNGNLWSGNLQWWIQHRQLIPNHYKRG